MDKHSPLLARLKDYELWARAAKYQPRPEVPDELANDIDTVIELLDKYAELCSYQASVIENLREMLKTATQIIGNS